MASLSLDSNLGQLLMVWLQLDVQTGLGLRTYLNDARLVSHGAESNVPTLMALDNILAIDIRHSSNVVALVLYAGKGKGVTRIGIRNSAAYLLGAGCEERGEKDEYDMKDIPHGDSKYSFFHLNTYSV